ncbi:MAG: GNAT family N-acetyltransferase [Oscillospiraceae bacterium]|jgi:GNAT superfamily N-acetyltransferase|nr:GNAT family N-acetyltransferase [Oscillospiraceae bacterium]
MLFLRTCDQSDIPIAAQMLCRVYAEAPYNENWPLERAEKRIQAYLSGANSRGYALIIDTQIVGYLFGRMLVAAKCSNFYVDEIFVHPNYQRKGCGSLALNALRGELKKDCVDKIALHALCEDASFYEKNGFTLSDYVNMEKRL